MGNDERYGYILDGDYHVLCSLEIDVFRSAARQLDKLPVDAATQVSHLWYILPNGVKPLGLEDAAELEGWCRDVHAGLLVYVPSEDGRLGSFIRRTSGAAMTSARGARQGPTPQKKGKGKPRPLVWGRHAARHSQASTRLQANTVGESSPAILARRSGPNSRGRSAIRSGCLPCAISHGSQARERRGTRRTRATTTLSTTLTTRIGE